LCLHMLYHVINEWVWDKFAWKSKKNLWPYLMLSLGLGEEKEIGICWVSCCDMIC
jgi:hypothetical protein